MIGLMEAQAIVARVTYKPGWTLRLEDWGSTPFHAARLTFIVEAKLEDTYNRGSTTKVGFRSPMPPFSTEDQMLRWIRSELGRIELHERDEWIRVDGEMRYDPHRGQM